jgi:hypothetical protein
MSKAIAKLALLPFRLLAVSALLAGVAGTGVIAAASPAATAQEGGPTSSLSPGDMSFDTIAGQNSAVQFEVVTNSSDPGGGSISFHIPLATLSGPGASSFSIVLVGDGSIAPCSASTVLSPGQSCAIGIIFRTGSQTPDTTDTATLTVGDTASNTETAKLSGTVESDLPLSCVTPSVVYLHAKPHQVSAVAPILVKNCTDETPADDDLVFDINIASLSGADPSSFSIVEPYAFGPYPACNPGTPLHVGQTCSFGVIFRAGSQPSWATDHAIFKVFDNASDSFRECANLIGSVSSGSPGAPDVSGDSVEFCGGD